MTGLSDAEYDEAVARVQLIEERWHHALGLGWWRVTLTYDRSGEGFHDEHPDSGFTTLAKAKGRWMYGLGEITFNIPACADTSDEDLERVIVHEICHILVAELRSCFEDKKARGGQWWEHEEHVVTALTSAFMWVRDGAAKGEMS